MGFAKVSESEKPGRHAITNPDFQKRRLAN